jgi:hypothetical protein
MTDKQPRSAVTAAIAVVFTLFYGVLASSLVPASMHSDFLNLYTGASLARDGQFSHLHDPDVQFAREQELFPAVGFVRPFVRPHLYAAFLAPLSLIPFATAYYVWITTHVLLLLGCWIWAAKQFGADALILGSIFLPAALGIAHAQDGVFMLVILASSYALATRGSLFKSGLILGLALFKFHLILLFPIYLLLRHAWRTLAGFAVASAAFSLLNVWLAGYGGIALYLKLLQRKDLPGLSPSPELMVNLYSIPVNLNLPTITSVFIGILVIGAVVVCCLQAKAKPWLSFAAACAGSLLVAPHVYGYDTTLVLLPVWLCYNAAQRTITRVAAIIFACPLPFFLSLAGSPWSAAPAIALTAFLGGLVLETRVDRNSRLRVVTPPPPPPPVPSAGSSHAP